MSIVAAEAVTRRFGSFTAVDRVDLHVERGEVVGLLGANGAGKTTLIRMLLGLLAPTSGRILLFDGAVAREQRRRVGYVPQTLGLYRDLTIAENLEFRADVFGAEPSQFGRGDRRLVEHLPLGVQRQAAFAAATQHDPELLVVDEPTSGVSPLARRRLWERIREQADRGAGVLVSTHYMEEATQADRLVVLARGRVVAQGSVADIISGRQVVEVVADDWAGALQAVDEAGSVVILAGRVLRILGDELAAVERVLETAGVRAEAGLVPASLNEVLVDLTRSGASTN